MVYNNLHYLGRFSSPIYPKQPVFFSLLSFFFRANKKTHLSKTPQKHGFNSTGFSDKWNHLIRWREPNLFSTCPLVMQGFLPIFLGLFQVIMANPVWGLLMDRSFDKTAPQVWSWSFFNPPGFGRETPGFPKYDEIWCRWCHIGRHEPGESRRKIAADPHQFTWQVFWGINFATFQG